MLKDKIQAAGLQAAKKHRQEGDFLRAGFALWLARVAAGIQPSGEPSGYADHAGCAHLGCKASEHAVEFNHAYA